MSIFRDEVVTCPSCGETHVRSVAHSINGERAPHWRAAILAREFQQVTCETCACSYEVDHPFNYIDLARGQWVRVQSGGHARRWRELEHEAREAYDLAAGRGAGAIARELVGTATVRTVFGLEALREKLVCWEAGLDDVLLEVLKLEHVGVAPGGTWLDDRRSARLAGADPETLAIIVGAPGEPEEALFVELPRATYDAIAADRARWTELAAKLAAGPFVDLGRVTITRA